MSKLEEIIRQIEKELEEAEQEEQEAEEWKQKQADITGYALIVGRI